MISIIVPTYNEETTIKKLLNSFSYNGSFEIIVADAGSSDRTKEFAEGYPVKFIECRKNRALQMNEAVKAASGGIFLFLHCDCRLENGSLESIEEALNNGYIGGCLTHKINSNKFIYRFIEASGNIRAKLFRIFYGDQAIFSRRDTFFKLGGFAKVGLFEDVIFSKNLKKQGRTGILNKKVYTSPRRWEKQGIIKTTLLYWLLTLGFLAGVSTHLLEKMCSDIR